MLNEGFLKCLINDRETEHKWIFNNSLSVYENMGGVSKILLVHKCQSFWNCTDGAKRDFISV